MNVSKHTLPVIFLLLTFLFSNIALAVTYSCKQHGKTFSTTLSGVGAGGFNVINTNCSTLIDNHWNNFGMEKEYWDDGLGFNNVCSIDTQLNRTFRALELLRISKNTNLNSDVALNFAYDFSKNAINHLRASCAGNAENSFGAGYLEGNAYLYQNAFGSSIMWLSATVLHEARHKQKSHNLDKDCPRKASCDNSYEYDGANAYELAYSWWYGLHGNRSTKFTRQMGLDNARRLQNTAFNQRPGFNIHTTAQ